MSASFRRPLRATLVAAILAMVLGAAHHLPRNSFVQYGATCCSSSRF
jgi:hypothetical protein